jgi:phenol 2-monooxygenase
MPTLLRPSIGRFGLCDYEKVFCADGAPHNDIFELRGINRTQGCMVVVRPDQYVGHVLPLTEREQLTSYFAQIFHQTT